jgi:hypothetical protein
MGGSLAYVLQIRNKLSIDVMPQNIPEFSSKNTTQIRSTSLKII